MVVVKQWSCVDEPMAYSSGGRLIYWSLCCDREAGVYDITIPFGQPNRIGIFYGITWLIGCTGYQQMYNGGNPDCLQQYGWLAGL